MRVHWAICGLLMSMSSLAGADVTLQNDGFTSGMPVGFESGFVTGEIAASRFVAPDAGRQLLKVQLIFGPDGQGMTNVTLRIYDDTAGTDVPGTEIHSADFSLVASSSAIQEMDVTADNIMLPQQFRIGIEFQQDGLPSVVRDDDMTIAADKNFIKEASLGWKKSSALGLTGDWVIRAVVSGTGGGGGDSGIVGGSCNSNTDCGAGAFCDLTAHTCTFECRMSADCPDNGTCNSLGMCVGGSSGGCCETSHGAPLGAIVLGVGVLLLIGRRRRT